MKTLKILGRHCSRSVFYLGIALILSTQLISAETGNQNWKLTPSAEKELLKARSEIQKHFTEGLIPFWAKRGVDKEYGGYLTCYDADGNLIEEDTNKYIVTQTRMIWGYSLFHKLFPDNPQYLEDARQGVDFFIKHFWDPKYGGWYWKVARDGSLIDNGKVVYGQSFAIYALTEYYKSTGDKRGLDYAVKTFDLLQKYCVDAFRGGYYENLENDWTLSSDGFHAGDRKSLDIHMHLLECFTNLYQASGQEIHKRRLQEVIDVILKYMVDPESGCGLNQFSLDFTPIPAIAIRRTWNAEREGESVEIPLNTTSYGHNVELAWLLVWAGEALGKPRNAYEKVTRRLVDHSLKYGLDYKIGGIYRDGVHEGPALVKDKEFWQNAEALVSYLDSYEITGDERYLKAFHLVWNFINTYMINHKLGEWMTLIDENGKPIVPGIGNPWKCCYHSGRSLYESLKRIDMILKHAE